MLAALVLSLAIPTADLPVAFSIPHLSVPRLQLASEVVDIGLEALPLMPTATPSMIVPPRYGWILDDGRAFWFAAGASSVVALGTHVLLGIPTAFIGGSAAATISQTNPAAVVPFLVGLGGGYMLAQTALSSLAALLVFNNVSKVYNGNYAVALASHIAGSLLGVGVSGLTFGVGLMLTGGLAGLVEFTGSAGVGAIVVFSFLGALPAVVIGGIALVGVPALIGAWGLAVSATTKEGYVVNPAWRDPLPEQSSISPLSPLSSSRSFTAPAFTMPLLTIPLPG